MNSILLFDGASKNDSSDWKVINDGVMGGVSESRFFLNSNSNACFQGTVSLENNGGFCSVQCQFKTIVLKQEHYFSLLLKGDGKKYQFRIKRQLAIIIPIVMNFKLAQIGKQSKFLSTKCILLFEVKN